MARHDLNIMEFENLYQAIKEYEGNTENAINDVLHNEAGQLIQDAVKNLIPQSHKRWKGKKPPAKTSNSLMQQKENLSITVKTRNAYHYLYFPDDGSSTRRHVGNKHFFQRGGESQQDEIANRCVEKLVNDFNS